MRFMIMVKASAESEAMDSHLPDPALAAAMADYHDALARAGILLDAHSLLPSSRGWRIADAGGQRVISDGPFAGTGELLAAYLMIQVRSRDEAMEWTRRFPATHGEIEVRQVDETHDIKFAGSTSAASALHSDRH